MDILIIIACVIVFCVVMGVIGAVVIAFALIMNDDTVPELEEYDEDDSLIS